MEQDLFPPVHSPVCRAAKLNFTKGKVGGAFSAVGGHSTGPKDGFRVLQNNSRRQGLGITGPAPATRSKGLKPRRNLSSNKQEIIHHLQLSQCLSADH